MKEHDFSDSWRGAVVHRITIYLDNDVLQQFRERADSEGRGYQTLINDALGSFLESQR
jgi:uncharacterized protein (DUF4415 family)